jgi:hypothetical protein
MGGAFVRVFYDNTRGELVALKEQGLIPKGLARDHDHSGAQAADGAKTLTGPRTGKRSSSCPMRGRKNPFCKSMRYSKLKRRAVNMAKPLRASCWRLRPRNGEGRRHFTFETSTGDILTKPPTAHP